MCIGMIPPCCASLSRRRRTAPAIMAGPIWASSLAMSRACSVLSIDSECSKCSPVAHLTLCTRIVYEKYMLCAIYARVSTTDQNCEMQLKELREYISRRDWKNCGEYVDTGFSGAKASRPALDR